MDPAQKIKDVLLRVYLIFDLLRDLAAFRHSILPLAAAAEEHRALVAFCHVC